MKINNDIIYSKKYQSNNTNKIIVSQDFGEKKYCNNSRILYIINDKF